MLYPYFRQDIEAGRIAPEQAFELLCCLWIKLYRDYDVQQSCVGGCGPDAPTHERTFLYDARCHRGAGLCPLPVGALFAAQRGEDVGAAAMQFAQSCSNTSRSGGSAESSSSCGGMFSAS